jgi:uncharacterized protein (DUF934 family)
MQIIKDHQIIADHWLHLDDEAAISDAPSIVSWPRWQRDKITLQGRATTLGVQITGGVPIEEIAADLSNFSVVAVHFPKFADGRCYSHARLLRDRYGFKGEIRATGDVLRDQLFYMSRCGINAFEIRSDRNPEDALKSLRDFSVTYQPASDQPQPLYRRQTRCA